jgi:hypothetical protein
VADLSTPLRIEVRRPDLDGDLVHVVLREQLFRLNHLHPELQHWERTDAPGKRFDHLAYHGVIALQGGVVEGGHCARTIDLGVELCGIESSPIAWLKDLVAEPPPSQPERPRGRVLDQVAEVCKPSVGQG